MKTIINLILLVLASTFSYAQTSSLSYFEVEQIGDVSEKKRVDHAELRDLAEQHIHNGVYQKAYPFYQRMAADRVVFSAQDHFNFAQCLRVEKKYTEAEKHLSMYAQKEGIDYTSKDVASYLEQIEFQSNRYSLQNLTANTAHSEIPVSTVGSKVFFLSNRSSGVKDPQTSSKTFDIWEAESQQGGQLVQERTVSKINKRLNEGGFTLFADGKRGFFTQNDRKTGELLIVWAKNMGGKWEAAETVHFCSSEYSVMHPVLSKDERKLYFTSDMPGGYGQTDIYVVDVLEDGNLGQPKNLGDQVNTFSRECFPFVNKDGDVYFASNGHNTLGGLDVFVSLYDKQNKQFETALNVGAPVNSIYDDFSYMMMDDTHGYFASNRSGGSGGDDMFGFTEQIPLRISSNLMLKQISLLSKDGYSSPDQINRDSYYLLPKNRSLLTDPQLGLNKVNVDSEGTYQSNLPLKQGAYYAIREADLDKDGPLAYNDLVVDGNGKYEADNYIEDGEYFLVPKDQEDQKNDELIAAALVRPDGTYESEDALSSGDYYLIPKQAEQIASSQLVEDPFSVSNGSLDKEESLEAGKYMLIAKEKIDQLNSLDDAIEVKIDENKTYRADKPLENQDYYMLAKQKSDRLLGENTTIVGFNDDESYWQQGDLDKGDYLLISSNPNDLSDLSDGVVNLGSDGRLSGSDAINQGDYYFLPIEGELIGTGDIIGSSIGVNPDGTYDKNAAIESGSYYLLDAKQAGNNPKLKEYVVDLDKDGTYKSKMPIEKGSYYLIPTNEDLAARAKGKALSAELLDDGTYNDADAIAEGSYYIIPKYTELIEDANLGMDAINIAEDGTYKGKKAVAKGNYYFIPREDILNTGLAEIKDVKDVKNIYFELNSSLLETESVEELETLVSLMLANPKSKVQMSGFADSRGSEKYNMWLSENRAKSAAKYLMKNGIVKERVYWKAMGEVTTSADCPNGDCDDDKAFALDRRVEFLLFE